MEVRAGGRLLKQTGSSRLPPSCSRSSSAGAAAPKDTLFLCTPCPLSPVPQARAPLTPSAPEPRSHGPLSHARPPVPAPCACTRERVHAAETPPPSLAMLAVPTYGQRRARDVSPKTRRVPGLPARRSGAALRMCLLSQLLADHPQSAAHRPLGTHPYPPRPSPWHAQLMDLLHTRRQAAGIGMNSGCIERCKKSPINGKFCRHFPPTSSARGRGQFGKEVFLQQMLEQHTHTQRMLGQQELNLFQKGTRSFAHL